MIDSEIQRTILSKCSFFMEGAKYSQMKEKELDNDLFNYHLQTLVKRGLLEKVSGLYFLTQKGKSIVTNIDEESKQVASNYKVSVYLFVLSGNKVLLHRRLKHPQYGYVGLPSGKMKYGESIIDAAKRELLEETNLTGELKIVGNFRQIRKDKSGEVIEDGVFYTCFTNNYSGELLEKQKEGENFWVELNKVKDMKKLFKPSVELAVAEVKKRIDGKVPWETQFIYELLPEPEEY